MKRILCLANHEWVLLAAITGVAALLRFLALDRLPPGLYHDEAYYGLDALQVLRGFTPIFFEANNGREPLFIYLLAASIRLWGRSPGALRFVAALVGTTAVPAIYWVGREFFDRRVATMAAVLAATAIWTLNLSRVAFRAVTLTPLAAIALVLLWRGLSQRRSLTIAWAGLIYGLTFYTYLAARFTILALLLLLLYTALWRREAFWARGWLLFMLVSAVVVAPLALYFLNHAPSALERAGQVSILSPAINGGDLWGTLAQHVARTLRGFFDRGDFIPRHNVPLRPVFDPLTGLAFLGGVGLALWRARRQAAAGLVLIWFGVGLLPTILAEDAPHMLRASAVLPVLYLFPALGLAELAAFLTRRGRETVGLLIVWGVLALGSIQGLAAYARHLHSEAVYYQFETGATELAVEINRHLGQGWQGLGIAAQSGAPEPNRQVYIASRLWRNWPSVRYLCLESDALHVLPDQGAYPAATPGDVLLALWPFEDHAKALALLPPNRLIAVREGARERGDLDKESRLLYVTWRSAPPEEAPHNLEAQWPEGIRLLGYRLEIAPDRRHLLATLYWQATQPVTRDYTVFCHVTNGGQIIGQHDGPPAQSYYPMTRWRAGDIVEDRHEIDLSAPYEAQTGQVMVGLYRLEDMQRLTLLNGPRLASDRTSLVLQ